MKLPNGFENVSKLPGKRRKPWRARKTVVWETDYVAMVTRQKFITVGYYETRQEAIQALAAYNLNPYDIQSNITFEEVYEKWSEKKFEEISRSNKNGYQASFKLCSDIYKVKFTDVKLSHLQGVVDSEYLITQLNGREFRFNTNHGQYTESYWKPLLLDMGILEYKNDKGEIKEHTPDDTRHTFTTMWKEKKLDEAMRRKIQGHSGKGIGEMVYTHYEFEKLREELNKL